MLLSSCHVSYFCGLLCSFSLIDMHSFVERGVRAASSKDELNAFSFLFFFLFHVLCYSVKAGHTVGQTPGCVRRTVSGHFTGLWEFPKSQ